MEQSNDDASPSSLSKDESEPSDYDVSSPSWDIETLSAAAIALRLPRPRSLAWAILLRALPGPSGDIAHSIQTHRNFYNDLQTKLSMDPRAVEGDDPLSQNDESAWKQHFCDNELKALIMQDVVRTFPDEVYFRDRDVQEMMVRVLFFWSRAHVCPGYRQGMHEVLAPLLLELYTDRRYAPVSLSDTLKIYLDDAYLEHDSFMLFSAVMRGLEKFYTTGEAVPNADGRLPVSKTVHNPTEVVRYLESVRSQYLAVLDPELVAHLDANNITMELFGIRWLRLLWGREFPRAELPTLWGFLFADGPQLPHLHYVLLATLTANRGQLLSGDAGSILSLVMRPSAAGARHVARLALHLRRPNVYPRPTAPVLPPPHLSSSSSSSSWTLEQTGAESQFEADSLSEGVAEGADVARELAALGVLRARLPAAAYALAAATPRPAPDQLRPLQQILQLAALLQCRNHALVDVETALEAAEGQNGQNIEKVGQRQLVPVSLIGGKRTPNKHTKKPDNRAMNSVKEVPLKLFNQMECVSSNSDLPCLDPLRLRTE